VTNNLTRDEARTRAALLTVSTYDVSLDLTVGEKTFGSTTRVAFTAQQPGAGTFIELTAPAVRQIMLNGAEVDPASAFDGDRITLTGLAADNVLVVVADCAYSRSGEGLHRFVDQVDGGVYLYTQFETYDAHRVYACFDQPDLKAVFTLDALTPADWTVISNATLAAVQEVPGGRSWRFNPAPLMSTYLTAIVGGPYYEVRSTHDGIDLGLFCRRSLAEHMDAEELFTITRQGFDFYHRAFEHRYPFGKYDQLFVPEFNAGAMENPGAVTFLEDYLFRSKVTRARFERRAETVLHEMAHMWFGDLVTMRWWDDLWLNESFATYASVLCQTSATEYVDAWTTFANAEKTWAYRQDQLPSTHPIAADASDMEAVKTNFDGITYAKGASVLKQLVAWVGQEEFLAGLRVYFTEHAWGNAALADLLSALEASSGRDLSDWSAQWLETTGVNTLRPVFAVDAHGAFTSFAIEQTAVPEHPTLRAHRVAVGLYDRDADGALVRVERVELDVTGPRTEVPKLVGLRRPALVLINDDDLTYAKVRLDPASLETLVSSVDRIAESLPRTLCWTSAWDMVRDAEIPARDYLRLVLRGVGAESDIGVVGSLLAQARSAVLLYGAPARRSTSLREYADRCLELALAAQPGSDHQLAFIQAFASGAASPEHVRVLRGLLDGSSVPAGLQVDTDLRWSLLVRLATLGAVGEEDIAGELARDSTAAGEKRAATARAARPDPTAKQDAWAAVLERDDLSNHLRLATIGGFAQPEQEELLSPYVERYFTAVGPLWGKGAGMDAMRASEGLFPSWAVDGSTVERTDAYLARDDLPPPLRRIMVEARDGLARALRARTRDAG